MSIFKSTYRLLGLLALSVLPVTAYAQSIKIASIAPDGSAWMTEMRAGGERVEKRTEGRVKFKFYPGGVMGDDQAVLRKMKIGQLHGGALTAGSLSEAYPETQLYSLPLMFRNLNEVDAVRKHFDSQMMDGIEKGGLVSFGFAEGGFAYIMSNAPLKSLSDVRKHKVWIPSNDPFAADLVKSFNITPTPLPLSDVLVSLQSGLIDTVATAPIGALALQWHNQVKYLTELPLLYVYATFVIDKKIYGKLSALDQSIVREEMSNVFKRLDEQNRKDNSAALAALKKQGIQFVSLDSAMISEWYATAEQAAQALVTNGKLSADKYNEMQGILSQARKAK